ncbi:hypothetical protein QWY22_17070 [Planococcus liqunii]|uniref:Antitoxin VbhA domain-containing protein n=1 Tax=Planococcus liqunii TaxID=3058394 RepID=A0ABT8MS93_9BACL|nr:MULTISPECIES: hypothetical protein [Planococcus]MDN7227709.1 hypothetical protein [Planococcus sp. N064]WKA53002.1 hypothetical protein QWY22_17070 [Planococcus sp. N056]SDG70226.1 hypothetical protein SAMN04487975_101229 [Planococcus glaciei]
MILTKLVNRVSREQANHAISYASHSLTTEGFNVTNEDQNFVRSVLTGEQTEAQFHRAIKTKFNV